MNTKPAQSINIIGAPECDVTDARYRNDLAKATVLADEFRSLIDNVITAWNTTHDDSRVISMHVELAMQGEQGVVMFESLNRIEQLDFKAWLAERLKGIK